MHITLICLLPRAFRDYMAAGHGISAIVCIAALLFIRLSRVYFSPYIIIFMWCIFAKIIFMLMWCIYSVYYIVFIWCIFFYFYFTFTWCWFTTISFALKWWFSPVFNSNLHDIYIFFVILLNYIELSHAINVAAGNYMSLISAFSIYFEYLAALFHA